MWHHEHHQRDHSISLEHQKLKTAENRYIKIVSVLRSPIHLILDRRSILFGYIETNKLSFNKNFMLIVAKYFIFKCSKEKKTAK